MKILFLCKSNVVRSQMAEAFFNKYSEVNSCESAGLGLENEKIGLKIKDWPDGTPEYVIELMDEEGIDVSNNLTKEIGDEMIKRCDVIYCIGERELVEKKLMGVKKEIVYWDVPDVVSGEYETFREARDKIKELVNGLVGEIG